MAQRLVIMCTHGAEDPERGDDTVRDGHHRPGFGCRGSHGLSGKRGDACEQRRPRAHRCAWLSPLKDLVAAYHEAGGTFLVCGPCVQSRKIDPEE